MTEEERADWLARAIDDLLKADRQSEAVNEPPAGLEEAELNSLMRVARARLDAARNAAHAGLQYEGAIWQQVLSRLDKHFGEARGSITDGGELAAAGESEDDEQQSWKEIMFLRRELGQRMASLAEQHRDAVWQRVESRLETHRQKKGFFSFLQRFSPRAAAQGRPVRSVADVEPSLSADEQLDELIRLARARSHLSDSAGTSTREREKQLTARIKPGLSDSQKANQSRRQKPAFNLATASALAALVIAAIGPIPATGLAGHPAVGFARLVGEHIGVSERSSPPAAVSDGVSTIEGIDISASEATALLGFTVVETRDAPAGFQLVSSRFFPQAITASEGGMFVLTYAGVQSQRPSLVIYQERAAGGDFAAEGMSVFDVTLADGTPATYIDGAWQVADGRFVWNEDSAQTLVFERGGVRTIVRYDGPSTDPALLLTIANRMASAR